MSNYTLDEMIGKKYGYLTVTDIFAAKKDKRARNIYFARCNCDCGKEHTTHAHSVKQGRTTSCGCRRDYYNKTRGENHPLFTGYKEIRGKTFSAIRYKAKLRNIDFNLSIKDLWNFYESQNRKCALSGVNITWWDESMIGVESGTRCTVSVDRIDSSKGYVKDNIQLVHKMVNIMKNVYNQQDFIDMCKKIANNN